MKKTNPLILAMFCLFGISCEQTFEPFQESDYNYSIYGYLDLYSNEHWFRVNPIREKVSLGADWDSLGLTVTLKRESTGSETELSGQRFTFFEDGKDTTNFWNYFSDDSIYQQEEYTITVTGEEGLSSHATARIPPEYPVPVSNEFNPDSMSGIVTGTGIDKFIVAEITYIFSHGAVEVVFIRSQLENISMYDNGDFSITFSDLPALLEKYGESTVERLTYRDAYMIIASGNESWPESAGTGSEENALPDAQRNVQDGLGVVAGVAAYKISLEPCYDPNNIPMACPPRKIKPSDLMVEGDQ